MSRLRRQASDTSPKRRYTAAPDADRCVSTTRPRSGGARCVRPKAIGDYCWKHGRKPSVESIAERFWALAGRVDDAESCWLWTGYIDAGGYGYFHLQSRQRRAHRFAYELTNGSIPGGLVLDHLCRNRACVRPDHLEPVTHTENVRRGDRNQHLRKTVCDHGHSLLDPSNVLKLGNRRVCRSCSRARNRAYALRKRAAGQR